MAWILVLLIILATSFPVLADGGAADGITWTIEDGILTISGSGAIPDYSYASTPWYADRLDITGIVISEGVTSIGKYAFYNCTNVESISLPSTLTSIGNYSISGKMTSIDIPASVTDIDTYALNYASSLSSINVESGNTVYLSIDGVLYKKLQDDTMSLEKYPVKKPGTDYVTADGTSVISEYSFGGVSELKNIIVSDGVVSIESNAFSSNSIETVKLPESLVSISISAVRSAANLKSIEVAEGNASYKSEDGILFNADKTVLICYPRMKNDVSSYTVPDSVEKIGDYAFYYNRYIAELILQDGVTETGAYAMYHMNGITLLKLPHTLKSVKSYCFDYIPAEVLYSAENRAILMDIAGNPVYNLPQPEKPIADPDTSGYDSTQSVKKDGMNLFKSVKWTNAEKTEADILFHFNYEQIIAMEKDYIIIYDDSSSMVSDVSLGNDSSLSRRILMNVHAESMINAILDTSGYNNRVGQVLFSSSTPLSSDFTSDTDTAINWLYSNTGKLDGSTVYSSGFNAAAELLASRTGSDAVRDAAVIFITDGSPNSNDTDYPEAAKAILDQGYPVYSVYLGSSSSVPAALTKITGSEADVFHGETSQEIADTLSEVLVKIASRSFEVKDTLSEDFQFDTAKAEVIEVNEGSAAFDEESKTALWTLTDAKGNTDYTMKLHITLENVNELDKTSIKTNLSASVTDTVDTNRTAEIVDSPVLKRGEYSVTIKYLITGTDTEAAETVVKTFAQTASYDLTDLTLKADIAGYKVNSVDETNGKIVNPSINADQIIIVYLDKEAEPSSEEETTVASTEKVMESSSAESTTEAAKPGNIITGDATHIILWIVLVAAAAVTAAAVIVLRKKSNKER